MSPHEALCGDFQTCLPLDIEVFNRVVEEFQLDKEKLYQAILRYKQLFSEKIHAKILQDGESISVDLDGTTSTYSYWKGPDVIGAPIDIMIERIKGWRKEGKIVKIFTARANPHSPDAPIAIKAINEYFKAHIGEELPVTAEKDMMMKEIWDDRAKQVIPNTGIEVKPDGSNMDDVMKQMKELISLPARYSQGVTKRIFFYISPVIPQID